MPVAIVKQNIAIPPSQSPQALLTQLQDWAGLIWLADDTQPVLGLCPRWQVSQIGSRTTLRRRAANGQLTSAQIQATDFAQTLQQYWQSDCTDAWHTPPIDGFRGGLLGYLGYDWAAARYGISQQANHAEHLDDPDSRATCRAWLGCYDIFLRQHADGWQLYGPDCPSLQPLYSQIAQCLQPAPAAYTPTSRQPPHPLPDVCVVQQFAPRWSRATYQHAFERVQNYLKAGDCYQVNLTQAFDATIDGRLLSRLDQLLHLTRAPYAGYLAIDPQHELLSCSPELFLSFLPNGEVVTRPIKGTQPRHSDPQQDQQRKQQLAQSEKDQAENLMIVDLLRNDLARLAKIGSVRVPKLFEIESFAQVHHLVSEIRATLATEQSALDLLLDALPGGSITGAPKIRAMQIIAELEAGARGAYCGSMGYLNTDGTGRFNILIRTLERVEQQVSVWAGGGITIASDLEQEYQECLDKVGAIMACVQADE